MGKFLHALREKYNSANFNWLTLLNDDDGREQVYTHQDLINKVNSFLHFYKEKNVGQGDVILIIEKESLNLFASFFAAIVYGAIPAFYAYPSPKQGKNQFLDSISHLTSYNKIKIILTFAVTKEILACESCNYGEQFLGIFDFEEIDNCNEDLLKNIEDGEEFFLQFSSGTTGAKKGVKLSTEALFNQVAAYKNCVDFGEKSKVVSWLPHYHDMGLIACMITPFILNIPIIMMSPFHWVKRPVMLLEAVQDYQGTHIWLPNFALGHLTNTVRSSADMNLSSLQKIICCSEPVLHDTVNSFIDSFNIAPEIIQNCYAMAENTFAMTTTDKILQTIFVDYNILKNEHRIVKKEDGYALVSVGKPLNNIEIKILNNDKSELTEYEIGEVHIKSDCMLSNYHNNPEETEKAFYNGWFNTGDLGFFAEDNLYITGRKKELIIVGGENIYPQDIEQILNNQQYFVPGRNVVFGVEDKKVGTEKIIILAEIEQQKEENINIAEIKTLIFNKLNISIAEIQLLPKGTLKKSTAGKISRFLNQQEYLKDTYKNTILASKPKDTIVEIVKKHIHDTTVQITEEIDLMESGLINSFSFASLVQDLEQYFNKKLPSNLLRFEYFRNITTIKKTFAQSTEQRAVIDDRIRALREENLQKLINTKPGRDKQTLKEKILNYCPFPGSFFYRWVLRLMGIKVGRKVSIKGRIYFKVRGKSSNIIFDDYATISRNVDLRNRENGVIHLHRKAYLDCNVRLVAARDGRVDIEEGAAIGAGTIINSGGVVKVGRYAMIAANVNINSSDHKMQLTNYMQSQSYRHGKVIIEDDAWIGSGVSVLINTHIEEGAVISSNSSISGRIPAYSIFGGIPAKVIKYREIED